MNKTTNYQLNQWERTDRVLMEDFNADNEKLDAAIKEQADGQASLQAAVSALQTAVPKKQDAASAVRFTYGTYAGNGTESRVIPLPFTPKAVLVFLFNGCTRESNYYYGGLAIEGAPVIYSDETVVATTTNGFIVGNKTIANQRMVVSNDKSFTYRYIAFA